MYIAKVRLTFSYAEKLYPRRFESTLETSYSEHENNTVTEKRASLSLSSRARVKGGYEIPNVARGEAVVPQTNDPTCAERPVCFRTPEAAKDLKPLRLQPVN